MSVPDLASARIDDLPGFGRRAGQRLAHGYDAVDTGRLVRFGDEIEDLDDVRIEVEVARALDVQRVRGQRRPALQRGREARIDRETAPVGQLARLLDQELVGGGRGEVRDEPRSG